MKTDKAIIKEKDWTDIWLCNDTVIPDWKIHGKKSNVTISDMAKEFGIPIKEYIIQARTQAKEEERKKLLIVMDEAEKKGLSLHRFIVAFIKLHKLN